MSFQGQITCEVTFFPVGVCGGYVFAGVCLSMGRGLGLCPVGLCPGMSLSRRSLSSGISVQWVSVQGVSVQWVSVQDVSVQEVSVQWDLCPVGICSGGLCQEGSLSRESLSGESLSGGLCHGVSVQGGLCQRVSLSRCVSVQGDPPDRDPPTVTIGRCASYLECILVYDLLSFRKFFHAKVCDLVLYEKTRLPTDLVYGQLDI